MRHIHTMIHTFLTKDILLSSYDKCMHAMTDHVSSTINNHRVMAICLMAMDAVKNYYYILLTSDALM